VLLPCSGPLRSKASLHWDGGLPEIPPLRRFVRESDARAPSLSRSIRGRRRNTPKTAGDILDRLNEIFLQRAVDEELRMIALRARPPIPDTARARAGPGIANAPDHDRQTGEFAGLQSSMLNGIPRDVKAEGRKSAADFLTRHGETLVASRAPISMCCWQSAEA